MRTYWLFKKEFMMETHITKIVKPTVPKSIKDYQLSDHKVETESERCR